MVLTILTGTSCVLLSSVQEMAGWLPLTFFVCLHNQLSSIHTIITYWEYRCLKNVIHQIDSKNEWLFLSASFTAKLWLVFVSTLENAFSRDQTYIKSSRALGTRFQNNINPRPTDPTHGRVTANKQFFKSSLMYVEQLTFLKFWNKWIIFSFLLYFGHPSLVSLV